MRSILLAAAVALGVPAMAADLPFKAPQSLPTSFPIASSGLYYGLYVAGAAGSAGVNNVPAGINSTSLISQQGEIGGTLGYRFGSSNMQRFIDLECDLGYMNLNGTTAGLSLSGPIAGECGARIGVPAAAITSLFPNLGLPNFMLPLPTGVNVLSTQMYVGGAARFEDISANFGLMSNQEWSLSPAAWVGMIQGLSNGTAIDARFEYIAPSSTCIGPVTCAKMSSRYMAKVGLLF